MNRPIKFRAWDKKLGQLIQEDGFLIRSDGTVRTWYGWQDDMGGELWDDREDVELMQFTGLHDKNGKEIYEGDILKLGGDSISYTEPVVLKTDEYKGDRWYYGYPDKHNFPVCGWGEIIGNIYENPELIQSV